MEFKVMLTRKTSEGQDTTLKFEPVNREVCDCDCIITKVLITTPGYFVGNEYTVNITEYVSTQPEA